MVSIKWFKFLSYNFILFYNKLHFPHNVFCFMIPYLHRFWRISTFVVLVVIRFLSLFLFFFLSIFYLISLMFFFLLFSLFSQLHHFLNLVCHFLRASLSCSPTFCWPGVKFPRNYNLLMVFTGIFAVFGAILWDLFSVVLHFSVPFQRQFRSFLGWALCCHLLHQPSPRCDKVSNN